MKHIAGWFRRNNTIMAQAKDLQRQWQEMRDERDASLAAIDANLVLIDQIHMNSLYLKDQLHRVARERDNERKLRLAAEKLRDVYLEQLENEEE